MDVIKTTDWIINLRLEGGKNGEMIIAEGMAKDVAESKVSFTGQFLKPMLAG